MHEDCFNSQNSGVTFKVSHARAHRWGEGDPIPVLPVRPPPLIFCPDESFKS